MKDVVKWGDAQQYHAEPHPTYQGEELGVVPEVHLQWMTPDPLGCMAMAVGMYEGRVFRSIEEVTDKDRGKALDDMLATHLTAGLEVIRFQFLFDGVDRAFTHQDVRQRTAVFFQESLRFAVPGTLKEATSLPPSLHGTGSATERSIVSRLEKQQWWRQVWDECLASIDAAYHTLVNSGMPAEEARGLLPQATATRIVHNTDLRNLIHHAGNRLCTQAQFHWRVVWAGIIKAIGSYRGPGYHPQDEWQYKTLAESGLFKPVCYQLGRCPFKATFDRECKIRDRVDLFQQAGVASRDWEVGTPLIAAINPAEWLLDPAAARK